MSQKDVLSAYSPHFHGQSLSAPHCHSQVIERRNNKITFEFRNVIEQKKVLDYYDRNIQIKSWKNKYLRTSIVKACFTKKIKSCQIAFYRLTVNMKQPCYDIIRRNLLKIYVCMES